MSATMSEPVHVSREDLFRGLPASAAGDFADIEKRLFYASDTVLFKRDEPAFALFVIHRGSVALSNSNWEEGLEACATSVAGEILGLSAIIAGEPYQASARTLELSDLGVISRGDFLDFMATHSDFTFRLVGLLSEGLNTALNHLRDLPPIIQA
ncbi:MAG TPA: cyclic nucleotide-binding domain-containing protein [Terriglobia bacterium]|nr:cyclic nucleotide-binding domain-containing protein [Terriglobia bacterium]